MTREWITFEDMPPKSRRLPMVEWLRRHGCDAGQVCVPGWIERDEENFRVRYLAYHLNERGNRHPVPGTGGWMDRPDYREPVVATEVHTVQLEGPPLPFPNEWRAA